MALIHSTVSASLLCPPYPGATSSLLPLRLRRSAKIRIPCFFVSNISLVVISSSRVRWRLEAMLAIYSYKTVWRDQKAPFVLIPVAELYLEWRETCLASLAHVQLDDKGLGGRRLGPHAAVLHPADERTVKFSASSSGVAVTDKEPTGHFCANSRVESRPQKAPPPPPRNFANCTRHLTRLSCRGTTQKRPN